MKRAIEWMIGNHVATNLFMWFIILCGIMSLGKIKREVFPETSFNAVSVSVEYRGATPDEIEKSILIKIEEAIASIEGIETITSTASEGLGSVNAQLFESASLSSVKEKIKSEVDRIITFPQNAEKPVIKESVAKKEVISLVLSGDVSETLLKELANTMKDDLAQQEGISQVEVAATRNYEISITLSEETLRKYGITLDNVSRKVRAGSLDLPGGKIETKSGEITVRTQGKKYVRNDYEKISILSTPDGQHIRLKDIATIDDGFEENNLLAKFNNQRAATIKVYRIGDEDPIHIANAVKQYVKEAEKTLPQQITLDTWLDDSENLKSRISLLTDNAISGLILVVICLSLFLDFRLSLWVCSGIVISFLGSIPLMSMFGASINMVSIFAFILVLGIVVDDAVVVGENTFKYREMGYGRIKSAILGVKQISTPVLFSVSTSIAAFAPLLFISGFIGKMLGVIPVIVISVLVLSLIESLFILPAHLSSIKDKTTSPLVKKMNAVTEKVDAKLNHFIQMVYLPFLHKCLQKKRVVISTSVTVILITLGLFKGEFVSFVFFPEVEGDNMIAKVELPEGSTFQATLAIIERIESASEQVKNEFNTRFKDELNGKPLFKNTLTSVGQQPSDRHNGTQTKPHIGEINIELLSAEERPVSSRVVAARWREIVGDIPGVKSLTFEAKAQSAGADIQYKLTAPNYQSLSSAVTEFKEQLQTFTGVQEITDDFQSGKQEFKLDLKPLASSFGLTLTDLANQVRYAFYGAESLRLQRGKHEVRVMVRYPKEQRRSLSDIENLRIRTANGDEIPFSYVADVRIGEGYSVIKRYNRQRTITVTADVDDMVANANEVNSKIRSVLIPRLQQKYAGLSYHLEGAQKEQITSMNDLAFGFTLALFVIFSLLAIPFKSYTQPLVIMALIPFGIVGATVGHVLLGYDLSISSMLGMVALSGIVVNDSLVLVDYINQYKKEHECSLYDAVVQGCIKRFRPILLTSLTTFFGLLPMMMETSLQAQFLIPMAISLGIGVLFATIICLLLIPVSLLTVEQLTQRPKKTISPSLPEVLHEA